MTRWRSAPLLALSESGFSVPGDISVTGVDDIPEAAFFMPPLTTIRVDFAAHGRAAVHELLGQINHTKHLQGDVLASELISRRSTGPAAGTLS